MDYLDYIFNRDQSDKPSKGLWASLSTMKFAIWILIILGVLSLAAMFIGEFRDPRALLRPPQTQLQAFGRGLALVFQMDDPFQSWWYRLLVGILCLSLFACLLKRIPMTWKVWRSQPADVARVSSSKRAVEKLSSLSREQIAKHLRPPWRFRKKTGEVWIAEKSRVGMWGPILTHTGMLLLGMGALVTSFGNFTTRAGGYAGDVVEIESMPFAVRVDSFRVRYYPLQPLQWVLVDNHWIGKLINRNEDGTWRVERWKSEEETDFTTVEPDRIRNRFDSEIDKGNIQKYIAYVTVLKDGRELETEEISVNSPLRRSGFRIYQSSYDTQRPRFEADYHHVRIAVSDSLGTVIDTLTLAQGETARIPGDTVDVIAGRLLPDFKLGSDFNKYSETDEFLNPALEVIFSGQGGFSKESWLFQKFPSNEPFPGRYTYRFVDISGEQVRMELMTIFQIKRTHGTSILWAGFLIGTLGLILSFYFVHRTIYLVQPAQNQTQTRIIGLSRKMPLVFERDLDRLAGTYSLETS